MNLIFFEQPGHSMTWPGWPGSQFLCLQKRLCLVYSEIQGPVIELRALRGPMSNLRVNPQATHNLLVFFAGWPTLHLWQAGGL